MSFIFILSDTKKVLSSLIFIMTNLNALRLIPLMCKLQWLMNNTFYLMTGAQPKCFKTGPILLPMTISHMSFLSHANPCNYDCEKSLWLKCLNGRLSDLIWEYFGNIKEQARASLVHDTLVKKFVILIYICSCFSPAFHILVLFEISAADAVGLLKQARGIVS